MPEGVLLCEKYPRLFRLEVNKDESVGEKRVWGEGVGNGNGIGLESQEVEEKVILWN